MDPTDLEAFHQLLFRLAISTLLGGILGIDRDLHRKPAGIRVLSLVCMGSCAISMVSVVAVAGSNLHPSDGVLRTIQGVLSGIGFLGAGVIMRAQGRDEVHGITTAASIWISSILGMICGLGQWRLGVCAFGMAWLILIFGRRLEILILKFAPRPAPTAEDSCTIQPERR